MPQQCRRPRLAPSWTENQWRARQPRPYDDPVGEVQLDADKAPSGAMTQTQRMLTAALADIWCEILVRDEISPSASFF
jgi:hypothetical protein